MSIRQPKKTAVVLRPTGSSSVIALSNHRLTEAGDTRLTEAADRRTLE
jgi:hypothetical protein